MKLRNVFAAIAVMVVGVIAGSQANATVINNVTVVQGNATAGPVTNVTAGNAATAGSSVNKISLSAIADPGYVNGSPFRWQMSLVDFDGVSAIDGNTKYEVTVTLTNNRIHPISPVTFSIVSSTGVVANLTDISFVSATSPTPSSTYNTVNFNGVTAGVPTLHYGGLNGGGGELYTGQTGTFVFHLDVADFSAASLVGGSFDLMMVANPEPTSLALAGLAVSAAGFGAARRRKKKAGHPEEVAAN